MYSQNSKTNYGCGSPKATNFWDQDGTGVGYKQGRYVITESNFQGQEGI